MKYRIIVELSQDHKREIYNHLLPPVPKVEECAFAYASLLYRGSECVFQIKNWQAVPESGYAQRSRYNLELTDSMRGAIIKNAYDSGLAIVEMHSHLGDFDARFSYSDRFGFSELVPHLWWRLKGRPYLSIVFSSRGFDGLAWVSAPENTERLDGLQVGKEFLPSSKLSPLNLKDYYEPV